MAKVKFSALVSEMRNKLNGSVFSKNRGGNYLRNKVTPVNPQTAAQVAARSQLSFYSQAWKGLTQAQRDAWNAAIEEWATTDIFGDIKNPTGLQLYAKVNINIQNAGGAPVVDPPAKVGAAALDTVAPVFDTAAVDPAIINYTPNQVPVDHTLMIEATPQLSAGISNANSKFRAIQTEPAGNLSPAIITAAYTAKFGALVPGKKVFVRCKLIRNTTGEVSQSLVGSTIVL